MSYAERFPRKRGRAGLAVVLGLVAALGLVLFPGIADAKGKKKKDNVKVMTQNLYLGSDLQNIIAAANEGVGVPGAAGQAQRLKAFDHLANAVGVDLNNIQTNDFVLRAKTLAKEIKKNVPDVVGLQEAELYRLQIPSDGGGPSAANPNAFLADTVLIDYVDTLLEALNKKAMSKKQCKQKGLDKVKCYRGYRLASSETEADVEQPGDFDNNPGPNGIGGEGPAFTVTGVVPQLDGTPPCASTLNAQETNPGGDDTGVEFGDPGPPNTTVKDPVTGQVVPFDWNGDSNSNSRHAGPPPPGLNCGPDTLAPHVFGGTAPPYQYASDCPDNNPLDGMSHGADDKSDTTSSCLFHGIDGDARLTDRDVIIVRKGAGVKTSNPTSGHFGNQLTYPVLNGVSSVTFTRGWTAVDVKVRGKKFHLLNTHLEAFSDAISKDQATELVTNQGAATHPNTVLVGDLNSDPSLSNAGAYNEVAAGGYASLSGPGNTSGHAEILNNPGDNNLTSRIDHILTNSPGVSLRSSRVLNPFANGLWASDHAGVLSVLNVKGGKKHQKKK